MKEKINFIKKNKEKYTIDLMCNQLRINRKIYYKYRLNNKDKDREDFEKIEKVFKEGKETYGVLRIKQVLEKDRIIMNHKKIRRIMRKYGLSPKYMKVYKPHTRQEVRKENIRPNLLNREFIVLRPNEK